MPVSWLVDSQYTNISRISAYLRVSLLVLFSVLRFVHFVFSLVSVICFSAHETAAKRQLWEILKPEIRVASVELLSHEVRPSYPLPGDTDNRMSFYKVFRFSSLGQPRCQTERRFICFDSFSSNYLRHGTKVLKVFDLAFLNLIW